MLDSEHKEHRYDPNYLKAWLYNEKCRVTFTKRDGTQRVMLCTLRPDYLPEQLDLEEHANSHPDHVVVWDLEKKAWRSFRYDSVVTFKHLDPPMSKD